MTGTEKQGPQFQEGEMKRCKVHDPQETWPYTKRCENEHDENAKACKKHLEIFAELGLDPKVLEEL